MNTKGSRQHSPTPPKQKWQNICLALCILLGILASCETEESFYQPRFPANDVPLTRQALFKPENFFAYTDSTLKAVISALRRVEEEKHFTASFLLKYGIPLWNFTYKLTGEETCIFVPLYRLDKPHCIDAIWLLHIKDGWMKFFPLKRDDELIRESDQVFIFDLLSYLVFGEENAQGLTFKPHAQTRSVITVTQCWDVYTGPKDQLEYSYTNCVSHSYWVDDALINNSNWNSEGGGSGDVWIGGGSSGGSGSSSGTPAGNIFKKEGRPRLAFMGNHRKHDSPNHGRLFGRRPIQPTERESQKQQNQSGIRFRQRVFLQLGRAYLAHRIGRIGSKQPSA